MKNKKVIALLIVATMAVSLPLSACGSSTSTTTIETTEDSQVLIKSQTVSGTVTNIDGTTITIETTSASGMDGGQPGGDAPEMPGGGNTDGEAPEMPSGEAPDGEAPSDMGDNAGTPPEKPDGETNGETAENTTNNTPPEKPAEQTSAELDTAEENTEQSEENSDDNVQEQPGNAPSDMGDNSSEGTMEITFSVTDDMTLTGEDGEEITAADIAVGDTLTLTFDENSAITAVQIGGNQPSGQMGGGMGGGSAAPTSYSAATEFTTDTEEDGQTYTSTGTDENAIHILENARVTLTNATVSRQSDDSTGGDNASFYGVGASILNTAGTAIIKDSTITSDSEGGAGVFSYGDGVTYVSDTTINTTNNTSGGIHVAGGGTLYAWNLDVTTNGTSSAAIRSDRGGGTMVVDGGSYTSNGSDSPAVYVTADITINDADLVSTNAEGVCIEGLNTLNLFDSNITSGMSADERNDVLWNIIVYQSQSGDSEEGNGTFNMTGGSITASEGGIFYTTNTESTFYLNDVTIAYPEDNQFFLRATGNSNSRGWGSTGANGADTNFTADNQDMEGDIITDSISFLDFYMENGSTLTGAFVRDESNAGNGGNGETNVYISSDSTWTVTGDSIIDNLYNEGTILDAEGNTVTIVDETGSVLVEGTSSYTITVGTYSTTADFSGATNGGSFSDYEVEQQ